MDEEGVRKDRIKNDISKLNRDGNPYIWGDLFGKGPAALVSWTSSYSEMGVIGQPELASKEKGEQVYHEAVRQLGYIVEYFRNRPIDTRSPHQGKPTTMPMPWGQSDLQK